MSASVFDTPISFAPDQGQLLSPENPALVFVTKVGEIKGLPRYEFLFSLEPDSACGPQWENICERNVEPPLPKWVSLIARFEPEELELTLLEELDNFRYLDGVFGFVALAFEYIEDVTQLPSLNAEPLHFHYGERLASVRAKLQARDLDLLLD